MVIEIPPELLESNTKTAILPPRMIRDKVSGLSTGKYQLNTYQGQKCPKGTQATFQTPSYVYTNGTALFQQKYDSYSAMISKPYQCIEKYLSVDNSTSSQQLLGKHSTTMRNLLKV